MQLYISLLPFSLVLPLLAQELVATTPVTTLTQPTILTDTLSAKDVEIAFLKKEIARLEGALSESKAILKLSEEHQSSTEVLSNNCRVDLGITKAHLEDCRSDKRLQVILGSVTSVASTLAGLACILRPENSQDINTGK